jgi:hypothetical protein
MESLSIPREIDTFTMVSIFASLEGAMHVTTSPTTSPTTSVLSKRTTRVKPTPSASKPRIVNARPVILTKVFP